MKKIALSLNLKDFDEKNLHKPLSMIKELFENYEILIAEKPNSREYQLVCGFFSDVVNFFDPIKNSRLKSKMVEHLLEMEEPIIIMLTSTESKEEKKNIAYYQSKGLKVFTMEDLWGDIITEFRELFDGIGILKDKAVNIIRFAEGNKARYVEKITSRIITGLSDANTGAMILKKYFDEISFQAD